MSCFGARCFGGSSFGESRFGGSRFGENWFGEVENRRWSTQSEDESWESGG